MSEIKLIQYTSNNKARYQILYGCRHCIKFEEHSWCDLGNFIQTILKNRNRVSFTKIKPKTNYTVLYSAENLMQLASIIEKEYPEYLI